MLLVALTVGATVALVVMVLGASLTMPGSAPATEAPPLSTRGVVLASASCTDASGRDLVEFRGADGRPATLPLDACGTPAGTIVSLTVPAGDTVAHLAGSGSPTATGSTRSPMGERLAVALGALGALGAAGLLVALGRRRWSPAPSRRPARAPAGR